MFEPIDYALHYGGHCRDCADRSGSCDNGVPCDPNVTRAVAAHIMKAWSYGIEHGFMENPFAALSLAEQLIDPEGWQLVPKRMDVGMIGAWYRYKNGHRFHDEPPARDTSDVGAWAALLAAAPSPPTPVADPDRPATGKEGEFIRDLVKGLKDLVEDLEMRSKNGVVDCSNGVYCTAHAALTRAREAGYGGEA